MEKRSLGGPPAGNPTWIPQGSARNSQAHPLDPSSPTANPILENTTKTNLFQCFLDRSWATKSRPGSIWRPPRDHPGNAREHPGSPKDRPGTPPGSPTEPEDLPRIPRDPPGTPQGPPGSLKDLPGTPRISQGPPSFPPGAPGSQHRNSVSGDGALQKYASRS